MFDVYCLYSGGQEWGGGRGSVSGVKIGRLNVEYRGNMSSRSVNVVLVWGKHSCSKKQARVVSCAVWHSCSIYGYFDNNVDAFGREKYAQTCRREPRHVKLKR